MKARTFRLLNAIGLTEFLPMTRVKTTSILSKYHAQHELDHFIPIDVLFDAERVTGSPILTELLCEMHGYRMVPIASAAGPTVANVEGVRMRIADAVSILSLTTKQAGEDGVFDAAERREIDALCDDVVQQVRALQDAVHGRKQS